MCQLSPTTPCVVPRSVSVSSVVASGVRVQLSCVFDLRVINIWRTGACEKSVADHEWNSKKQRCSRRCNSFRQVLAQQEQRHAQEIQRSQGLITITKLNNQDFESLKLVSGLTKFLSQVAAGDAGVAALMEEVETERSLRRGTGAGDLSETARRFAELHDRKGDCSGEELR